jgi:hypothetical protein
MSERGPHDVAQRLAPEVEDLFDILRFLAVECAFANGVMDQGADHVLGDQIALRALLADDQRDEKFGDVADDLAQRRDQACEEGNRAALGVRERRRCCESPAPSGVISPKSSRIGTITSRLIISLSAPNRWMTIAAEITDADTLTNSLPIRMVTIKRRGSLRSRSISSTRGFLAARIWSI